MTFDASDPRQVRAREKAARATARRRAEFIMATAATQGGREFLWNQLVECHVFQTSFDENPYRMYFLEGERSRGLALLAELTAYAPDAFTQMMREANERNTVAEQSGRQNANGRDQGSSVDHDDSDGDPEDDGTEDGAFYGR